MKQTAQPVDDGQNVYHVQCNDRVTLPPVFPWPARSQRGCKALGEAASLNNTAALILEVNTTQWLGDDSNFQQSYSWELLSSHSLGFVIVKWILAFFDKHPCEILFEVVVYYCVLTDQSIFMNLKPPLNLETIETST